MTILTADERTAAPAVRGADGSVRMRLARVGGRTRMVAVESRAPLQVLGCHYLDPGVPDMASVMIASPSGGVLQGDRLRIEVELGPGARLHLDTQGATRLYRMPTGTARLETTLALSPGAYLEYVPDPYVPYAGSAFEAGTRATVDEEASLLLGDVIAPGRAARGEVHQMSRFECLLEVVRPSGELVFSDAVVLEPGDRLADPGMLGRGAALGSLHAVHQGLDPAVLRAAIETASSDEDYAGASSLPGGAGAWLRVVAADTAGARRVVAAGHAAARWSILGSPLPQSRKP